MAAVILHGLVLSNGAEQGGLLRHPAPDHDHVRCTGVTALVSPAPDGVRSLDPDGVANLALRHHAILQAYCNQGAVLPLRFGSVFSSDDAVRLHIAPRVGQMATALKYLETHQEYTLRLTVSQDPLALPQPARTGREFLARGRDQRDLRLGSGVRRADLARRLADAAQKRAVQIQLAGARRPERALDLVMLVPTDAVTSLSELVEQAGAEAQALGLELTFTGPWPAYSYCLPEAEVCDGA